MFKQRTLTKYLKQINSTFRVLLITGPRQVGKTTVMVETSKKKRTYVTLDDTENRLLAKTNPKTFLKSFGRPLLIDEIQYAPELLPYIKIEVDTNKKYGMFWLTGSQQFHLMKNVTESLAGRVGILELQGLSQSEKNNNPQMEAFLTTQKCIKKRKKFAKKIGKQELYELIWRGSFPEICVNKKIDRDHFYDSYIQTYIERDVRDLTLVKNKLDFIKFLGAVASRTGQLLNYEGLANDVGVDQKTIKSWLSILATSRLIYMLEPFSRNVTKRFIKRPKVYFLDTGLCCYLTGWDNARVLEKGAMSGQILETYVISELLKGYWHNGLRPPFYFYRDRDGREIDLLIYKNGTLYPIEIKKKSNPDQDDVKSFSVLEKFDAMKGRGAVICLADKVAPINEDVDMVPIGYL